MKITNIELQFTCKLDPDNENSQEVIINASIDENGQWQQWGAPNKELAENVDLIERIAEQISL